MMRKQLLLMRHAKADRDAGRWADFERPLNERGRRDAPAMGRWLAQQGLRLDFLLTSPAVRTRETAQMVAESLDFQGRIESQDVMYEGSCGEYLSLIRMCPAAIQSLLVVGHNPTLEQLVERLSGEWATLKTSAVALLEYREADWSLIGDSPLTLVELWTPKGIGQA